MTRPREVWFERGMYAGRVTWRPIHPYGWLAIGMSTGAFLALLATGIIAPLVGADAGWTLAVMVAAPIVAVVFLLTVRGRIRDPHSKSQRYNYRNLR
jgi:hypothetical protein